MTPFCFQKGPVTDPVFGTAPLEDLPSSCNTNCSHCHLVFQPITMWCGCLRFQSQAFCRSAHLLPYLNKNQRQAWREECLVSEMRQAGVSSSLCRLWTGQDLCTSRCRPPPSHPRVALLTRASSSSISPSRRTLTEPLFCYDLDCATQWITQQGLCLRQSHT